MSLLTIYIILSYIAGILGFAHEICHDGDSILNYFKKHNDIRYILLVIFIFILSPITEPISIAASIYYKISDYLKG